MAVFNAFSISSSALTAQRLRMDIISQNIANVNTTRTADGTPYRRKTVVFAEREGTSFSQYLSEASKGRYLAGGGVRVSAIVEDPSPFREVYDPSHPDADENGIVRMPNVEIVTEMVNMISATRAYEANITALNASKSMASKALEIGR
ncbi:MAG TPA: flagellar basal body rod protein FlgC [Thermoclostridium caenicola]|uniref:Flagellar basal-body rod protein FlgC n=1 Tax=Thermoclostridium caenicola TaxID=659425 RepID=A0A1M6FXN8_9FIRM|nr:flagellar basal body rod protein FlgC [Thermoclostridium caenicola]SHJ02434.1 flagellar basal-body rod protein FlgC [Thermoclostridium caenicola]HOK42039.1 flagellar basal body rod protein FlgC [Thermoclostridium caenicola]HOL85669.1 flagellar basal body rod protein FlgC [Thermoclostridium caenicola]HOP71724.1 flagellar basal body rod protein FlgC [Thermoclostridium caenicola]HPO75830.1 flagellar basal body rod protein FlgC [Thermoclostridium caenicola]